MIRKDLGHKHAMHLDVLEEIINLSRDTYYQQSTMTRTKLLSRFTESTRLAAVMIKSNEAYG